MRGQRILYLSQADVEAADVTMVEIIDAVEAAFRVLKSALVPSALIELAYVSNKEDAANLKSEAWRDRVSASIVAAINRYFSMTRLPL